MYDLFIRAILVAAVLQIGQGFPGWPVTHAKIRQVERASLEVIKIDWKAISIFPEEAKRFKAKATNKSGEAL